MSRPLTGRGAGRSSLPGGVAASHKRKPPERGPPEGVVPRSPSPNTEGTTPMSSTDTDRPGAGRRGSGKPDADEIADQIDAIRTDLQNLTSTVGRIANKQLNRAQDKATPPPPPPPPP